MYMDDLQTLHAMGLDDGYHVERTLADGSSGLTELVSLDGTGPFVRKKMPLQLARRRLWSTLAECRSSRLPHIEATYELPDRFVVVYDWVPGNTLDRYVQERGSLEESETIRIAAQICEAVGELHAHGIIHRDITPSNIIIAQDGAHLIDFGIAREQDGEGRKRVRDTTTLGTWGYAAPEQYGFAATDARTDIYALGRLIGYMMTGVQPADASYERAFASCRMTSGLRAVIDKACAFEPSARIQTAAELRDDLERGYVDASLSSHRSDLDEVPYRGGTLSRRSIIWIAAGLVALLVAGGIGYAALHVRKDAVDDGGTGAIGTMQTQSRTGGQTNGGTGGSTMLKSNPLELAEYGWSATNGYVEYAIALRNTDAKHAVRFPKVTITGKDADGSVIFSDTPVFPLLYAGQRAYFAGQVGNGERPETVDFTIETPAASDIINTGGVEEFSVRGVRRRESGSGVVTFSGEVYTRRDDDNGNGVYLDDAVIVVLVLRDKNGRIVYGRNVQIAKPALGKARAFSVETYGLPDYDAYELYAHGA